MSEKLLKLAVGRLEAQASEIRGMMLRVQGASMQAIGEAYTQYAGLLKGTENAIATIQQSYGELIGAKEPGEQEPPDNVRPIYGPDSRPGAPKDPQPPRQRGKGQR